MVARPSPDARMIEKDIISVTARRLKNVKLASCSCAVNGFPMQGGWHP